MTEDENITHAMNIAVGLAHDDHIRKHCLWEAREVMGRIRLSDFETSELLAVLAVMCRVHSRILPDSPTAILGEHEVSERRLRVV